MAKGLAAGLPVARLADRFPPSPEDGNKTKKPARFGPTYFLVELELIDLFSKTLVTSHQLKGNIHGQ